MDSGVNKDTLAGAGKTKLVSTVVDSLRGTLRNAQNDESLAYFYCDRNQSDRQNPVLILSSFVKQLSTPQSCDAVQPSLVQLYAEKEKTGFASNEISIEESEKILLELVNIYPQTTLVLDALDECDRRTRGRLIEVLDGLLEQSSKPVKVFISSRPDQDIKDRFDSGPSVGIQATDNQVDISTFVDNKIEKSPEKWRKRISADLRGHIRKTLVEKSNGM
jgi:ankyrin repeat domain-containing protein 50